MKRGKKELYFKKNEGGWKMKGKCKKCGGKPCSKCGSCANCGTCRCK